MILAEGAAPIAGELRPPAIGAYLRDDRPGRDQGRIQKARAAKQRRGYDFERLLNALFLIERLDPRTSFKPDGEQIDGSIYLDGRIYLVEAKWHAEPLPASTLYQFKGKIDGKLAGTIGLFISMS